MKIDHDLRQAIKAAHKHQPAFTRTAEDEIKRKAVAKFFQERPVLKAKVMPLLKRKVRVTKEGSALTEQLNALLGPLGLDFDGHEGHVYVKWEERKFIEAGGDLSQIEKSKWQVDAVIAELAAADPKDAKKILAKYGINWS